jgi:hypothetical protein
MLKKLLLLYILLPFVGFSQNPELAIQQAKILYEKGEFLKSYEVLNTIKDKNTLENTNINLYKANLKNILNHHFFKTVKLSDSLNKVYIRTSVLKSQGVFNIQSNQYTVPPIYDSIANIGYQIKYVQVFKDKLTGLINSQTGKTIISLGDYRIQYLKDYFSTYRNDFSEYKYDDDVINVYDVKGNLIFENLNHFGQLDSNFFIIGRKNSKHQVINIKTKEIVIDNCDNILSPTPAIVENDIEYNNIWLPFEKNNKKYLYKITKNGIEDIHKFDNYIGSYNNYYYFENAIGALINNKDNAANCPEIQNRICYFSYYTIVKKDGKFGIFNVSKDQYYKEPVYDSISDIGNTFYKGKWTNLLYGEEITMPPAKDSRFIIFKKNNLYGFFDITGKVIVPANYDEILAGYQNTYHLRKGDKWGFTGVQKEDQLVEPQFDIILLRNGLITGYKNKKTISFLPNGTITNSEVLDKHKGKRYIDSENIFNDGPDNRYIFEKEGKYGLDDFENNEIVPPKYTYITRKNNIFIVSNDTLQGLIDQNGKELIPVKYAGIDFQNYSDLLFAKDNRGLQAIFNSKGEMLYPPKIEKVLNTSSDYQKNSSIYIYASELSHTITEQNNPANTRKFYKNVILKIKDNKVERLKIETPSLYFLINFLAFNTNSQIGFYNFRTGKIIESQFKDYIPDNNSYRRILAKKGMYYDTVIDSVGTITTLEHPFFEEKNGYYFYKDGNKTGILNKDLKAANFKYPVLQTMIDVKHYDASSEYKEKARDYFEFNTDIDSKKNGIIDYGGKIIVQSEKYDNTGLFYFEKNDIGHTYNSENGYGKKYDNELLKNQVVFVGINKHKDFNTVNLFSAEKGKIAEFKVNKEEKWSYGSYTSTIILRRKDSTKVYDIKTKKIILKVKANSFLEDMDSGFSVSDSNSKLNKYTKYDCGGQFILDTIFDANNQYARMYDENYIQIKNNKYGTLNSKRKPRIPFIYDRLKSINSKYFITKKDHLCGVVNAENQTIVDKKYQAVEWVEKIHSYSPNSSFYAFKIKENNNWGLIGLNLNKIIPIEFDIIKVKDHYIEARKDSLLSVYDFTGKLYIKTVADNIQFGNYGSFRVYKNGKEIATNKKGEQLDKNPNLSEEDQLKATHCKQKEGKYYLAKNDTFIHKTPITKFGIIKISRDFLDQDLDYLLIEDENKLCGLYTKDLEEVFPFGYKEIIYTKNPSFYIVNKNDKYGVVNASNQVLIPFEYDAIEYDYRTFFKCKKDKKDYTITPQNKKIFIQ